MFDIIDKIKKIKKKTFSIIEPLKTQEIANGLYAIEDGDSNYFVYKKGDKTILIDSGYQDSLTMYDEFKKININPDDVEAIFLTHIDSDHAGCMYEEDPSFKNANIYLHEYEKEHLYKKSERVRVGFIKVMHKLEAKQPITYFEKEEPIMIGEIKVLPILTSGHTLGHTCFLVDDKYLFVGDSLIFKDGFGYRFFDLLGYDNEENSTSLLKLKMFAELYKCKYIISAHTGVNTNVERAFKFYNNKIS